MSNFKFEEETFKVIKKATLERFSFVDEYRINPELIRVDCAMDRIVEELVIRTQAYIYGLDDATETHTHPTSWWDAFKERWFPKWAIRRWPISYTVIVVKRGVIYPSLGPATGRGVSNDRMQVIVHGNRKR